MGLDWILEIGWEGVEWIHPAQDRGRWRVLVNAMMNFLVLEPRSSLYILADDSKNTKLTENPIA
jgi:hypothetical protein